jgi:ATP-dependent DNA helicase RecG
MEPQRHPADGVRLRQRFPQLWRGGYIVLGVAEVDGQPQLPPKGVPVKELDRMQRELLQYCNLIQPPYFPIFGTEVVGGATVVMLWCPGGQTRPYKVPKDVTPKVKEYAYYIRRYANTVVAKNGELKELIGLTATVPLDDRINHQAELEDLHPQLIRRFSRSSC